MITDTIKQILANEAPIGIVTVSSSGEAHLVGTWNSYVELIDDRTLAYPAGRMRATESNVEAGSRIQMLVGSRAVNGMSGKPGAGFRLAGTARFQTAGEVFDRVKQRFGWCRAAVVTTVDEIEQQL